MRIVKVTLPSGRTGYRVVSQPRVYKARRLQIAERVAGRMPNARTVAKAAAIGVGGLALLAGVRRLWATYEVNEVPEPPGLFESSPTAPLAQRKYGSFM